MPPLRGFWNFHRPTYNQLCQLISIDLDLLFLLWLQCTRGVLMEYVPHVLGARRVVPTSHHVLARVLWYKARVVTLCNKWRKALLLDIVSHRNMAIDMCLCVLSTTWFTYYWVNICTPSTVSAFVKKENPSVYIKIVSSVSELTALANISKNADDWRFTYAWA